jgi:hypothetical protein
MSNILYNVVLLTGLSFYVSCNQPSGATTEQEDGIAAFNKDSLTNDIKKLASDSCFTQQ